MDSHNKKKPADNFKKALSVILMGTVCITAAASVAAFAQPVSVSNDDKNEISVKKELDNDSDVSKVSSSAKKSLNNENKNEKKDKKKDENKKESESDVQEVSAVMTDAFNMEVSNLISSLAKESKSRTAAQEEKVSSSTDITNFIISKNDSIALSDREETSDISIKIAKWCSIKLNVRGEEISKDVPDGTVSDALAYLNIKLGGNDKLNVKEDQKLSDGLEIVITNIETKQVTKTETVKYKTVVENTDELYVGEEEVVTEGLDGERKIVIEEKYVNGELESTKEVSNEITREAVNKVIFSGTAQKISLLNTNSGNISINETEGTLTDANGNVVSYTSVVTGSSTAYTADPGAICSTGRIARYGVVAVNPEIIPYGSILYIVSDDGIVYGYAVAGDTGGFIYNGTGTVVDLYYPDLDDCINYGRRNIHVYVLSGVSEDATYQN